MVKVSGFPMEARTDAILRCLMAAKPASDGGCAASIGFIRFHWIDDTSGVAECRSVEAAKALVTAASEAAGAAAAVVGASPATRVADPLNLKLEDMVLAGMGGEGGGREVKDEDRSSQNDAAGSGGGDSAKIAEAGTETKAGAAEPRGKKRPRPEDDQLLAT